MSAPVAAAPVVALPPITCERMTLLVPTALAPLASVAQIRAGIFATLAVWVGTPQIESVEPVPGGWRVVIVEGSLATAAARQSKR